MTSSVTGPGGALITLGLPKVPFAAELINFIQGNYLQTLLQIT
jgi:hypothetical protein